MFETLACYISRDQKRRVLIQKRTGTRWYTFEEQYFSDNPREMAWCPRSAASFPICDTFETALREARGRISWMAQDLDPPGAIGRS
jgi:hypothetical protein